MTGSATPGRLRRCWEAPSMRARARVLLVLVFVLGLTAFSSPALGAALPTPLAARQLPTIVTVRLGISASAKIQTVERGTDRQAPERIIPGLILTSVELGVRIDSMSVGRGFWSEGNGEVSSENDLDMVVTGRRDSHQRFIDRAVRGKTA